MKKIRIQFEKHENNENHKTPGENSVNHEIHIIPYEN